MSTLVDTTVTHSLTDKPIPIAGLKPAKNENLENLEHEFVENNFSKVLTNFWPQKMIFRKVFPVLVHFSRFRV